MAVGLLALADVARSAGDPIPLAIVAGVALLAVLAVVNLRAAVALAERRNAEMESLTRILQGLSRSMSPDAMVGGIVNELRAASGADHCVVVRRRPRSPILDATLVSASSGVPATTTTLPASLLEVAPRMAAIPIETGRGSRLPIPIQEPVAVRATAVGMVAGNGAVARNGTTVRNGATAVGSIARNRAAPAAGPAATFGLPVASTRATPSLAQSASAEPSWSAGAPAGAGAAISDASDIVAARIAGAARSYFGLNNTVAAPLITSMGVEGALILSRRSNFPWSSDARRVLGNAAREASAALERAYTYIAAETAATTDPLTGLPNRRYLEMLGAHLDGRRRGDLKGALMVDIDHFKQINDRLGHAIGDDVLRIVADRLTGAVRREDVPIRYGGEEFLVVLREADEAVATDVAQRVRRAVAGTDFSPLGVHHPVTVSVGVAVAGQPTSNLSASLPELIGRADVALYRAKTAGRDRVEVA